MILKTLFLSNFKNIASASLEMSPKINCFLGDNGMGKSNLLDAIYFLSFTKSFGRLPESMLIKNGEKFAILNGSYLRQGVPEELSVGLRPGARKTFKRGGKEYKRISTHIGLFPAVMISPADQSLVNGAADERRRFVDMMISQTDAPYLDALLRYNQALDQRNKMLKAEVSDPILFESIEDVMDETARFIRRRRNDNILEIARIFGRFYSAISGGKEVAGIEYAMSGEKYGSMKDAFSQTRSRDNILQYTSVGPHRDDILLSLDGMLAKQTASQGQAKSFTIALRLAQYAFIRRATGYAPLLLLDDIFDKLDASRVESIMHLAQDPQFGQIFITDTNRKHLDEIMSLAGHDYRMWTVSNGEFTLTALS